MPVNFLTFERFGDTGLAEHMAEILTQNGIECHLEKNKKILEAAYANNSLDVDISIKLHPDDFLKARQILEDFYSKSLDEVDKDYYLLDFTDQELMEIITKPDEWGYYDYALAQKLLKEHGKEIKPELAELLKKQRINDLVQSGHVSRPFIYIGYFSSVLGGILGLIIGAAIVYYKKTLPDGKIVYGYSAKDRNDGAKMILISLVSIVLWTFVRWYFFAD